jgi:glutamyl-Q tRNA(Asp) synthetase
MAIVEANSSSYIGRFAPSPTGPLHAGSLVAALASWLDAKAHGGRWLVRIEDVDRARCMAGTDQIILQQLAACALHPDAPPLWQSQRSGQYQQALEQLVAGGLAYPCACSRKDLEDALNRLGQRRARHGELIYPGTCRNGLTGKVARAWRLRTDVQPEHMGQTSLPAEPTIQIPTTSVIIHWTDRRLGQQQQDVLHEVGDFVLKRADDCFAYQLAVVVDDAAQGISDVVRGADLVDNTARQILLQRALHLTTPRYLHTPLVLGANGEKLSKQNGAQALDTTHPLLALNHAAAALGLSPQVGTLAQALQVWVAQWQGLYNSHP